MVSRDLIAEGLGDRAKRTATPAGLVLHFGPLTRRTPLVFRHVGHHVLTASSFGFEVAARRVTILRFSNDVFDSKGALGSRVPGGVTARRGSSFDGCRDSRLRDCAAAEVRHVVLDPEVEDVAPRADEDRSTAWLPMESITMLHAPSSDRKYRRRGLEDTRSNLLVDLRNMQRYLLLDLDEPVRCIKANRLSFARSFHNLVPHDLVQLDEIVAAASVGNPPIDMAERSSGSHGAFAATASPARGSGNHSRGYHDLGQARLPVAAQRLVLLGLNRLCFPHFLRGSGNH